MAVQHLQNRIAFEAVKTVDPGREVAVDEERFAPGDRVGAYDRMLGLRKALFGSGVAEPATIDRLAVMDRGQPLDEPLDRRREVFVGGGHAGQKRVAALPRDVPPREAA